MTSPSKILFPVDFSERCVAAAPYVAAVAKRSDAEVTLLHVLEPAPELYGPLESSHMENREAELKAFLTEEFTGVHVKRILAIGDSARKITEYAADNGVGVIMIPTNGYGP